MKSTWFKEKYHYEFAKLLAEADYGHHSYDTFRDWLEVSCISLQQSMRVFVGGDKCPKAEKQYCEIMKKYKNCINLPKAFGLMVIALEEKPHDFLGDVFHALGLNDGQWKGQFFTPFCISEMMALMTLQETKPDGYGMFKRFRLDEPACGGGGMIIAGTKVLRQNGFRNNQFVWQAADLDLKCVQMTYLQTSLLDIPCIIHHRNTLSMETWRTYATFAAIREPLWDMLVCPLEYQKG